MLGRLRMPISQCRAAYEELASEAFQPVNYSLHPLEKVKDKLQAKPDFDVTALESAVRKVIAAHTDPAGPAERVLLKDMPSSTCKVFAQLPTTRSQKQSFSEHIVTGNVLRVGTTSAAFSKPAVRRVLLAHSSHL